jgi:hypothetical protein
MIRLGNFPGGRVGVQLSAQRRDVHALTRVAGIHRIELDADSTEVRRFLNPRMRLLRRVDKTWLRAARGEETNDVRHVAAAHEAGPATGG